MKSCLLLIVVLLVGCGDKQCRHAQEFEPLDYSQTWRVEITRWSTMPTGIGVCKRCGKITDVTRSSTNGSAWERLEPK